MGEVTANLQPFETYHIPPSNHKLFKFLIHTNIHSPSQGLQKSQSILTSSSGLKTKILLAKSSLWVLSRFTVSNSLQPYGL